MTDVVATVNVTVNIHNTPREIWDALARAVEPQSEDTTTWITLERDGVTAHFYAPRDRHTHNASETA